MKKILIIENRNDKEVRHIGNYEVKSEPLYKVNVKKHIAQFFRKAPLLPESFLYESWTNEIDAYDLIIVWEANINVKALKYMYKMGASHKTVMAFVNKIQKRERKLHKVAKQLGIKQITYNMYDSSEYGIKYIPQFWDDQKYRLLERKPIEWDITFLGAAKDRLQEIIAVENAACQQGLKTNFWIVSNLQHGRTHKEKKRYEIYLDEANRSKAILDIVGDMNKGLTWRPLEAMFLKKKLITNYADIVRYDFYPFYKENILIIKGDNLSEIHDFICKEYVDAEIDLHSYTYIGWLEQIENLQNG